MPEIYLIGVNHMYQLGLVHLEPPAVFAEFRQFLIETIAGHGIRGIAEEMSRADLEKVGPNPNPFRAASQLNLAYLTITAIGNLTNQTQERETNLGRRAA